LQLVTAFFADLMARINGWQPREKGQTLVEYALIIALVSVALVIALTDLKDGIAGVFDDILGAFGGGGGGGS
jgi:Flp pilus assembly pilin Flp